MNKRKPFGPGSYPCPACGAATRVTDSRPTDSLGTHAIRRRRHCEADGSHRFTTFEVSERELPGGKAAGEVLGAARRIVGELARVLAKAQIGDER